MDSMSQFIEMFGDCVNRIKLSSLCSTFVDGDWIESKDQSELGIRLIQTGNVGNGFFKDKEDKSRYISEETFDNLHCTEIYPGDILVSRLPDPIGRACIIPQGLGRTITAVDCTIIRLKDIILPDYFIAYTMTPSYVAQINEVTTGTTRRRVSRANLGNILIPCPSIAKQQKFVAIAKQADKSKFGDFKSQFIEMFGNPLFNTKKWRWYSNINNVVTIVLGSTPNTKEPKYWDGDIKWITPAEMDDETFMINDTLRHITEFGVKSANLTKLPVGSVLFSTRAPIGKVGIAAAEMYCNQGFKSFICSNQVDSIFLYYTLKLNKEYLCSLGTGTTFKELSKKTVEGLKLGVPPIDLQKQFAIIYKQADKSKSYVRIAFKNLESMLGYCIRQIS